MKYNVFSLTDKAAEELAIASGISYIMYAGSQIKKSFFEKYFRIV